MSKKIFFIVSALFFNSFLFGGAPSGKYVYQGAIEFKEIQLRDGYELVYRLTSTYPAQEVMDWYALVLSKEGFIRCDSSIPDWQSYVEKRDQQKAMKFDRNAIWINPELKSFSMLVMTYISHSDDDSKPDNASLSVSFQKIQAKSKKQFIEGLDSLDISACLPKTERR